jgi:4-hydroxyphenylpyruvate dioxygenase-like putative hemolysin
MKKPDFDQLKKHAGDLKQKASELTSEATKTAKGIRQGVQVGVEVSKVAIRKAGEIVNKEKIGNGIDAVAKGTKAIGKTLEKASDSLHKVSKTIKGK